MAYKLQKLEEPITRGQNVFTMEIVRTHELPAVEGTFRDVPFVLERPEGSRVFTLRKEDRLLAKEILASLNE